MEIPETVIDTTEHKNMTTEKRLTSTDAFAATDEEIKAQYHRPNSMESDAAWEMLIIGMMLIEKRASMAQAEGGVINGRNQHSKGPTFTGWIEQMRFNQRKAYRYIEYTERILKGHLRLPNNTPMPACIKVDGQLVAISQLLTKKRDRLPPKAQDLSESLYALMDDKTYSEAVAAVAIGDENPSRITRAINGKTKGGTNQHDERKAFDKFTAIKLDHITSFLTVKKKCPGEYRTRFHRWRELPAGQRAAIATAFSEAVESWPAWLLQPLADKLKTELKMADAARTARNAGKD
jgi:hypothetical protein